MNLSRAAAKLRRLSIQQRFHLGCESLHPLQKNWAKGVILEIGKMHWKPRSIRIVLPIAISCSGPWKLLTSPTDMNKPSGFKCPAMQVASQGIWRYESSYSSCFHILQSSLSFLARAPWRSNQHICGSASHSTYPSVALWPQGSWPKQSEELHLRRQDTYTQDPHISKKQTPRMVSPQTAASIKTHGSPLASDKTQNLWYDGTSHLSNWRLMVPYRNGAPGTSWSIAILASARAVITRVGLVKPSFLQGSTNINKQPDNPRTWAFKEKCHLAPCWRSATNHLHPGPSKWSLHWDTTSRCLPKSKRLAYPSLSGTHQTWSWKLWLDHDSAAHHSTTRSCERFSPDRKSQYIRGLKMPGAMIAIQYAWVQRKWLQLHWDHLVV